MDRDPGDPGSRLPGMSNARLKSTGAKGKGPAKPALWRKDESALERTLTAASDEAHRAQPGQQQGIGLGLRNGHDLQSDDHVVVVGVHP